MEKPRRFSAHYLLTPDGLKAGGVVTVDAGGRITDISFPERLDGEAGVVFHSGIIVPGFVNAHCHLELSHLRGAIPPGGGFTEFAKSMRGVRGRFTAEERLAAARYRDVKMYAEGVSAAADICNGGETFALKSESRVRYHNFIEMFGFGADISRAAALREEAAGKGLAATITPHSTYSLGRAAFEAAAGGSENRPLSIHFLESRDETELFLRRGGLAEWYASQGLEPDFTHYGSPAERLAAQIPADRPVMLVHNCQVTQRDIDIVMGHFTAPVTWVLCPGSNRHISGFAPPVGLLRRNGLRVAVGTDSLASNDELSMVRELSMIEGVPLAETLRWATANGAEALGLSSERGSIEVGKSPGLVLLTGVDLRRMIFGPDARARRIV